MILRRFRYVYYFSVVAAVLSLPLEILINNVAMLILLSAISATHLILLGRCLYAFEEADRAATLALGLAAVRTRAFGPSQSAEDHTEHRRAE